MRSLNALLSRVADADEDEGPVRELVPRPAGDPLGAHALIEDLAATAQQVRAIATVSRSWDGSTRAASGLPPPPQKVELVFEPNGEIGLDQIDRARLALTGKRVRIVGGRRHKRSVTALEELGAGVHWLVPERRKTIRMAERWSHLDADRDIAVIVTGHIGHAVSGDAAAQCEKAGIRPVLVENAHDVADAVRDQALRGLAVRRHT